MKRLRNTIIYLIVPLSLLVRMINTEYITPGNFPHLSNIDTIEYAVYDTGGCQMDFIVSDRYDSTKPAIQVITKHTHNQIDFFRWKNYHFSFSLIILLISLALTLSVISEPGNKAFLYFYSIYNTVAFTIELYGEVRGDNTYGTTFDDLYTSFLYTILIIFVLIIGRSLFRINGNDRS